MNDARDSTNALHATRKMNLAHEEYHARRGVSAGSRNHQSLAGL
jgi:hypothetical protein